VGPDSPSRTPRPDQHLERTPAPAPARQVHRALQHPPAPPWNLPADTQRHQRRRPDQTKPPDPTPHHLRRTHQPVPTRCLNTRNDAQPERPQCRAGARPQSGCNHRLRRSTAESTGAPTGGFRLLIGPAPGSSPTWSVAHMVVRVEESQRALFDRLGAKRSESDLRLGAAATRALVIELRSTDDARTVTCSVERFVEVWQNAWVLHRRSWPPLLGVAWQVRWMLIPPRSVRQRGQRSDHCRVTRRCPACDSR